MGYELWVMSVGLLFCFELAITENFGKPVLNNQASGTNYK
jgi:hypothetical protein